MVGFDQISIVDQNSNPEDPSLSLEEIEASKPKRDLFRRHGHYQQQQNKKKTFQIEEKVEMFGEGGPPPPPGDDDQLPPPPGDDDNFDDSKHPSDDDDNDMNIPWDDDGLTVTDIYDCFTFDQAN